MKNIISIISIFVLIVSIISCGGNKEANQTSQNSNEQKTASSDNQSKQTDNKKEFFDMKYVYKGIRVDKAKFDEELKI